MPRRVKWFGLPTKKAVKGLNMQPWTPGSEQSAIFCFAYFAKRKDHLDLELVKDWGRDKQLGATITPLDGLPALEILVTDRLNGADTSADEFTEERYEGNNNQEEEVIREGQLDVEDVESNGRLALPMKDYLDLQERVQKDPAKCFLAQFTIPEDTETDDDYELALIRNRFRWLQFDKYSESKELVISDTAESVQGSTQKLAIFKDSIEEESEDEFTASATGARAVQGRNTYFESWER
jgi:hypothetical protein